jgi:phosphonate transport system ATP-binding protein
MALVSFHDERLGYAAHAVFSSLSLSIRSGERVALLGRSGAGKSTLIGAVHRRLATGGAKPALVPQEHALVPQLSAYHNIYMGRLERRGALYNTVNLVRPWPRDLAAIRPIAAALGLEGELMRPVERLSGGQKQRTAIGRAFWRGGEILLADEPVSAIDETQAREVLSEMAARFATVLVALHAVELARSFATRIVGLAEGRVMFDATATELSARDLASLYAA